MTDRIGRSEAAQILCCSTSTVRRLEMDGELDVERDEDGRVLLDRRQVEHLAVQRRGGAGTSPHPRLGASGADGSAGVPRRSAPRSDGRVEGEVTIDGEIAARVFAAFEAGRSPAGVVVELQLAPAIVRELHAEYVDLLARDLGGNDGVGSLIELAERVDQIVGGLALARHELRRLEQDLGALGAHAIGGLDALAARLSGLERVLMGRRA